MKTILLLTVLLGAALTVTAAAVEAVVAEAEAGAEVPLETQEELTVLENEVAVDVPEVVAVDAVDVMPRSFPGRFFSCPAGWVRYRNGCYLYVSAGRSWSSALTNCATFGASLASAHNLFEYDFLQGLTARGGGTVAWMGGFYFQTWRWVDQTPFDYSFWSTQNTVSRFQCMHVNTRAGWSNNNCANAWPSVCVKNSDSC